MKFSDTVFCDSDTVFPDRDPVFCLVSGFCTYNAIRFALSYQLIIIKNPVGPISAGALLCLTPLVWPWKEYVKIVNLWNYCNFEVDCHGECYLTKIPDFWVSKLYGFHKLSWYFSVQYAGWATIKIANNINFDHMMPDIELKSRIWKN